MRKLAWSYFYDGCFCFHHAAMALLAGAFGKRSEDGKCVEFRGGYWFPEDAYSDDDFPL
jgi:hypothetical protein